MPIASSLLNKPRLVKKLRKFNNYVQKNTIQNTILLKENELIDDSLNTSSIFNNYVGFLGGVNNYTVEKSIDNINFIFHTSIVTDSSTIFNYKIQNS